MGPRDKRRLAVAAVALGVVAAIVAAVTLIARSPHSAPTVDARATGVIVRPGVTAKLSYGMTKQEVLHQAGKPTRSLRDPNGSPCWQYDTNNQQGLDAIRVCFLDGRYSVYYMEINGRWNYKPRKINVSS